MNVKKLIRDYGRIVDQDPGNAHFARLGDVYLGIGDLKKALKVLTEGVRANPTYITGQQMLAKALIKAGYLPQAKERYEIVLRLDPSNTVALWGIAQIEFEQGNHEAGIERLRHILAIDPFDETTILELDRIHDEVYGTKPAPRKGDVPPVEIGEETEEVELGEPAGAEVAEYTEQPAPADTLEELFEMDLSGEGITQTPTADTPPPVEPVITEGETEEVTEIEELEGFTPTEEKVSEPEREIPEMETPIVDEEGETPPSKRPEPVTSEDIGALDEEMFGRQPSAEMEAPEVAEEPEIAREIPPETAEKPAEKPPEKPKTVSESPIFEEKPATEAETPIEKGIEPDEKTETNEQGLPSFGTSKPPAEAETPTLAEKPAEPIEEKTTEPEPVSAETAPEESPPEAEAVTDEELPSFGKSEPEKPSVEETPKEPEPEEPFRESVETEKIEGLETHHDFAPLEETLEIDGLTKQTEFTPPTEPERKRGFGELSFEDDFIDEPQKAKTPPVEEKQEPPVPEPGSKPKQPAPPEQVSEKQQSPLENEPEEKLPEPQELPTETGEQEEEMYTVTMAEIYAGQGQTAKAISIYENILKQTDDPEKQERITQRLKHLNEMLESEG